jgi:hypothetical protein
MDIYVNGNKTSLTQHNFVAKGGEGKIFKKGKIAYKIYEDLKKMIPVGKINELQILDSPSIIAPKDLILNKKKQYIGFTMDWLGDDVVSLCKIFTNTFRQNKGIENDMVINLVENIKKTTQFIHDKKCLIVDGNEFNYLVGDDLVTPYFIDVNSWKTPSFPATAIMSSIRDWALDDFSTLTDWFSFAIVSFQLFIGIHPFKGKHKDYKKNQLPVRIRDRVSVFNKNVSLPPTARDFNLIPSAYRDWYYKIFEGIEQHMPPMLPGEAGLIQVIVKLVKSTNSFEITMIREFDEPILFHNANEDITKTENKLYIGKTDYKVSRGVEVVFTPLERVPILVKIENNIAVFKSLKSGFNMKDAKFACTDLMITDNTLYLKNGYQLVELDFKVFGQNILPAIKTVWNIEPLASQIFSNVIFQSILGKAYLCIPLPNKSGKSSFIITPVPELDDFRVIDAKYENHICMIIGHKDNEYHRIVLVFDEKFTSYECRIVNGIDYVPLNFVVLDNGVCIQITEDNAVEIFLNQMGKGKLKRIEDPDINNNMRLCKDGTILKFFKEKTLYSMKMK